jgi:hypothetical protein
MLEAAQPNWLLVIAAVYFMYAFGCLMGAAWNASSGEVSPVDAARQRVMLGFGGLFGFIGAGFQACGQLVTMVAGPWLVLSLLAIIPMLLVFVAMTDQTIERARDAVRAMEPRLLPALAPMPRALITREAAE